MKDYLISNLVESGEIEKLKNLLKARLIEHGWRDEMKTICKAKVKDQGANKITVEELVQTIAEIGRKKVPEKVKTEVLLNMEAVFEKLQRRNDVKKRLEHCT